MDDNYYDCMHRVDSLLKSAKDTTFIIKGNIYKVEGGKLYIYYSYNWYLKPLVNMGFETLKSFETEFKKVMEG